MTPLTLSVLVIVCLGSAQLHGYEIHNLHASGRIDDEYLIVLHEVSTDADRMKYVNEFVSNLAEISGDMEIINKFLALRSPILHVKVGNEDIMEQVYQLPQVRLIEANVAQKMTQQCVEEFAGIQDWGLARISHRPPPDYPWAYWYYPENGGSNVRVYSLDTGIRTTNAIFRGRAVFGTNTIGGGNDDGVGHGSFCAGIAIGDICGVSRSATAVAVKVINDNDIGTTTSIIEGVNWTIDDLQFAGGRGVISMSLAGGASDAIDSAIASAVAANIPFVVAAGNSDDDACNYSPARSPSAITVGATDNSDNLASFSNWGWCVDILAPGVSIRSAGNTCDSCMVGGSGTSPASGYVAGAVASYLTENPTATPADVKTYLIRQASEGYIDLRGTSGTPNLMLYERCE